MLGLARAASDMISGPDPAAVPAGSALFPGPSKYAVLGSAGFDLPALPDMFSEAPGWRAAMLRRGTPDPFMSLVRVPTATFVNAVGTRAVADAAGAPAAVRRSEAFTMGLMSALAHATVAGARAALGLRATDVEAVESQSTGRGASAPTTVPRSGGSSAAPIRCRRTGAGGRPSKQATPLLTSYHAALEPRTTSRLGPTARGWPGSETVFTNLGTPLSPERVKKATSAWSTISCRSRWASGSACLTPIRLSPGLALLAGRFLPGASAWITVETVTERSLTELITVSDGIGSITPFIYSMIMWANVDDQPGEPFASALWTFLLRIGLVAGWIPEHRLEDRRPFTGASRGWPAGTLAHRRLRPRPPL